MPISFSLGKSLEHLILFEYIMSMSLRLIEIFHKKGKADDLDFLLKDTPILDTWHDHLPDGQTVSNVLIKSENTEFIIDLVEKYFSPIGSYRLVILPVEATIPRPEEPAKEEKTREKTPERISIEELYQKMTTISETSKKYIIMATIACIVAAIGLLKDDVAVIIGSMVIAPLLGPNMALSLATTLADFKLARKAIITNFTGFSFVLGISIVIGAFMNVDPAMPQIALRSNVSHYYIALALATGVAGAYAITKGVAEAMVGVMVAVAILPPLVAAGLLFGSKHWIDGTGALLLSVVNLVCINLSGVVTFILEGIQPKKWWEAKLAKKAVIIAITIWVLLLFILAILILLEQKIKLASVS